MSKPNIIYFIVYQGGIANVFEVEQTRGNRKRLLQSDFRACENYCRGLRYAGKIVKPAWCNEAGDIINRPWSVQHFDNAPFIQFATDFVTAEMR